MKKQLIALIRGIIQRLGIDIIRHTRKNYCSIVYPNDFSEFEVEVCDTVKKYTMTSPERIKSLINAVQYVAKNKIEGAIVECGVWKGGSMMAVALTLQKIEDNQRELYLYDTYAGMSAPTKFDVSSKGQNASEKFSKTMTSDDSSNWCCSSLEEVRKNVLHTQYPQEKIKFIKGKVEDTIPEVLPKEIAILRLDTDWYESTKHELNHLFPLLKKNGVLIIDDYGHWEGAKKAVDEYITDNNICVLLNRIDTTARAGIKVC